MSTALTVLLWAAAIAMGLPALVWVAIVLIAAVVAVREK